MAVTTTAPAAPPGSAEAATRPAGYRIASIDVVRGIVMLLMAIDHVRVYSGVPAGGPTPAVFFTRWVTHFVAPAFVFLAGTAAFLHGRKLRKPELSRFLAVRGVWLILLELTVIRIAWTFNFDFGSYLMAGVIWVIGWCMILLAILVHLPVRVIGVAGVAIIAGHNIMDLLLPRVGPALQDSSIPWFWQLLYFGGPIQLGEHGPVLAVLYTVVPWIGVMAAGYAFGSIMTLAPARRRALCLWLGTGAVAAFLLLRTMDRYGDPRPWHPQPPAAAQNTGAPVSPRGNAASNNAPAQAGNAGARSTSATTSRTQNARPARRPNMPPLLAFLNTSKYPASLLFLLMTLGPMFIGLAWFERPRSALTNVLALFGRVPLFYYLLHIPAIHAAACLVDLLRAGRIDPWLFGNHPMMVPPPPAGFTWSLPLLYLVTALVLAVLYWPCRWFAELKARKSGGWLSYL